MNGHADSSLYLCDQATEEVIYPHATVLVRNGVRYHMDHWHCDANTGSATVYAVPVGAKFTQAFNASEFGLYVCRRVPGIKPAKGNHVRWSRIQP